MSASREKKNRRNMTETAPVAAEKKGISKGLKRAITIVVSIILVAAIVFLSMVSLAFFQKHTTAAVANGHKLSPAMLNYYYVNGYQEMSSYLGLSTEVPLSAQEYPDDAFETWADYFIDYAAEKAADTYAIYEDAMANGFTLSDEDKLSVENEISSTELYATMYGTTADSLIAANYGTGCTLKSYREYLELNAVVNAYTAEKAGEINPTDAEIDAYYAENPNDFDGVTFRYFSVTPAVLDQAEGEEDLAACEEAANAIAEAAKGGEEAYLEAVKAYMAEDAAEQAATSTLIEDCIISSASDEFEAWLSDDARAEGDVFVTAEDETGYAVLFFLRNEDKTFQMPNVRHILIPVEANADEAAKAEAEKKAQDILDQYLAGAQTEEAFAELAKTHGGLYETIAPDTKADTFEAWCYDETRQVRDTGIVETQSGYNIMYFSGLGETYLDSMVESVLTNKAYSEWRNTVTADATYTVNAHAKRYMIEI